MTKYKPVTIPSAAFAFCRYGTAAMLWIALILQSKLLVATVVAIFLFSYVLKVARAPMIVLYTYTVNLLWRSRDEVVNEHAIRFAHLIGSVLGLLCLFLLYLVNDVVGWVAVGLLAALKSLSALGFCPATKLYDCANGGSCSFLGKTNG
ncbi:MAG: DUF4395 family protein [Patescibacteria group bacterium]